MYKEMNNTVTAIIHPSEFDAAEQEAKDVAHCYVHDFQKPFIYEGKEYKQLSFDWSKLTGEDGLAIENEMQALGRPVIVPTFSGEYLVRMAARACAERIGQDAICAMSLSDYNRIRSAARSFLLKSEQ